MRIVRLFHNSRPVLIPVVASVEKAALAKLRKSTGYSFSKCKEALQKHENDLKEAEQWLRAQAQAHGWEKATKLQGRSTAQGVISILSRPTSTVILEVNCETDFVARNKKFQTLVQKITNSCFQFTNEQNSGAILTKLPLTGEDIINLSNDSNRQIKDEIALGIGELGENIQARRAVCLKTGGPIMLAGYTHPTPEGIFGQDVIQVGKYGAVVAYKQNGTETPSESEKKSLSLIGRQLCQHIVGMNPTEIGSVLNEPPQRQLPESAQERAPPVEEKEDNNLEPEAEDDMKIEFKPEVDEHVLVNQDFLLDADITVRDFLIQNSIEVVDFVRFECGEVIPSIDSQ